MKLKPAILALAAASLGVPALLAQTTLGVGELSFISAEADANGAVSDGVTIVPWVTLAAGTVIKFTDNGMANAAGTAANNSEHAWTFTVGATAISAGTALNFGYSSPTSGKWNGPASGTTSANLGPEPTGTANSGISGSGDQIFLYQGTGTTSNIANSPTNAGAFSGTLVAGINFGTTVTNGPLTANNESNETYAPTSLVNGNAYLAGTNNDNAYYNGVRSGLTNALYRASTNNLTNFTFTETLNGAYDRATSFTIATSAAIHWDANGGTGGDGGAGTWDTTTNDRFKNNAAGTTSFRWVNSSAGNDHTAVFGGAAGAVTLASPGVTASGLTFAVDGYTIQSNTLSLAGATPTIIVTTASHRATISSTLAGSTGLTKSGAGTLNITGTNSTNIGATSVTAGTLNVGVGVAGTLTSAVTVTNTGSTLGGSGTITGNVTINDGAILAPGNSPGVMTVAGTTTLNSNSIFSWELNSDVDHNGVAAPEGTRGTNYDGLTSTNLTVASGAIFRVVLAGASADLSSAFWNQNQIWNDIFNVSGTTTNAATGALFNAFEVYNGTTNVTSAVAGQGGFSFTNSTLTWTAVPEPTSALAGLMLGAGLLRRRRVE